jgi:metal-responsive CopG/Arc/MetJ family transcriptional regulator
MKIRVSIPDDLVAFADEEASRRRTTRSGLLAQLLRSERLRQQVGSHIDRHGWDVTEDEEAWRCYQQRRVQEDYGADDW